jgi:hypothetical protein
MPLAKAMASANPWERYWACITAAVCGEAAKPLVPNAKKLLNDENLMARMRAAEFLGSIKAADPMPVLIGILNTATTQQEIMLTFNAVTYLRDYKGYKFDAEKLNLKYKGGEVYRRVDYLNGNTAKGISSRPPRKPKGGKRRP